MNQWLCKYCEIYNEGEAFSCLVCGNQSPILVTLMHKESEDSPESIFLISWKIENADTLIIDNGIGKVETEGESLLKITKNTILKLYANNLIADREFQLQLNLPKPIIELFTVNNEFIEFGKPSIFSWKVRNAENIMLSDLGDVSGCTNKEIILKASKEITLIAENANGKVSKQIPLTLLKPEILLFESEKEHEEEINLRWDIINAETVEISRIEKIEIEEIRKSSKEFFSYTIVAKNSSGETSKEVVMEVESEPIIENLRGSKSLILRNSTKKLVLSLKNASKVNLFFGKEVLDFSKVTEYSLDLKKTIDFRIVAHELTNLSGISKNLSILVIDNAQEARFNTNKQLTSQFKPIQLVWEIKNAKALKIIPDGGDITPKKRIVINPTLKTISKSKTNVVIKKR